MSVNELAPFSTLMPMKELSQETYDAIVDVWKTHPELIVDPYEINAILRDFKYDIDLWDEDEY